MTKDDAKQATAVHPMVAVPEAIRLVLTEAARALVTSSNNTHNTTTIPVAQALHQTVAVDVTMPEPGYPPYRASIMDGYAIRSKEFAAPAPTATTTTTSGEQQQQQQPQWTHRVVDKVFAGDSPQEKEKARGDDKDTNSLPAAYYITTGAMVPDTFDCVVPIEDIIVDGDKKRISINTMLPFNIAGKWIRPVGCDIPAGSVVLRAGSVVDPIALGLLAQCGHAAVQVRRPVTIGILSTGNELVVDSSSEQSWNLHTHGAQQGRIPDVNRPVLKALFQSLGAGCCQVHDLGTCRDDDTPAMAAVLRQAMTTCQVIITTGGISMGETDIVEDVLVRELGGTLHFGRIHMKPGKPSTFVTIPFASNGDNGNPATRFVFALPGNPVSAVVCSHLLVRPCLQLLLDGPDTSSADAHGDSIEEYIRRIVDNATISPPEIGATLTHDVPLDVERPEYHRVQLEYHESGSNGGAWKATSTGVQRSSRLASLHDAHALLALPQATPDKPKALAGETFPALLLSASSSNPLIRHRKVFESLHLHRKPTRSFCVGIVQMGHDAGAVKNVQDRVSQALSGSKSGSIRVVSTRTFAGNTNDLYNFLLQDKESDFHVVIGSTQNGSFAMNAAASAHLRLQLAKVADAIALQVRRGAAAQSPTAAIFETVVGFIKREQNSEDSLVIFLPANGLDGGLSNVRGLVKHALEIARGTKHAH